MSNFYGNLSNSTRSHFQFDKIFKNRYEMDLGSATDGIYIGRHVLVNYEQADMSFDIYSHPYFCYENTNGEIRMYQTMQIYGVSQDEEDEEDTDNSSKADSYNTGASSQYDIYGQIPIYQPPLDIDLITTNNAHINIQNGSIIRIEPYRHIYDVNAESLYVKITDASQPLNLGYTLVTKEEFDEYWEQAEQPYVDELKNLHMINNVLKISSHENPILLTDVILRVPEGWSYKTNTDAPELWTANIAPGSEDISWSSTVNVGDSTYMTNYVIDKKFYRNNRGYDSTVWQKVYSNGTEKYIMIAELNTIVPTFDVEAERPTLIPSGPHYDPDSTNMFYKLHQQPQWGFRIKAANKLLQTPTIDQYGIISESGAAAGKTFLRTLDTVTYPSDEKALLTNDFYDIKHDLETFRVYNKTSSNWDIQTRNTDLPTDTAWTKDHAIDQAIYYNKAGFNSREVHYSADLEKANATSAITEGGWLIGDSISFTPTGRSGRLYHSAGQSTGHLEPYEDTMELSIMLPSLGDSIAHMWDLVYGGRDIPEIAQRDKRNLEIEWEDGLERIQRRGLRLIGDREFLLDPSDPESFYNHRAVDTLAGCINSAHDLLGMIIVPAKNDWLIENIKNLDDDKIYYNLDEFCYMRKREKTDDYIEIPLSEYTFKEVQDINPENFNALMYYIINPESSENSPNEERYIRLVTPQNFNPETNYYKPDVTYYIKTLPSTELEYYIPVTEEGEDLIVFDGSKYLYRDLNDNAATNGDPLLQDYISRPKYYRDKDYYKIKTEAHKHEGSGENVVDAQPVYFNQKYYEPNKYFFFSPINGKFRFFLDDQPVPYSTPERREYFSAVPSNILPFQSLMQVDPYTQESELYDDIYVPGFFYYRQEHVTEDGEKDYDEDGEEIIYDYILDTSVFGDSNKVYFAQLIKENEDGEEAYKQVYSFDVQPQVSETNYVSYFYYKTLYSDYIAAIDKNDQGLWRKDEVGAFDPDYVYSIRRISLIYTNKTLTINKEAPLTLMMYTDAAFYVPVRDENNTNIIVGYESLDQNDLIEMKIANPNSNEYLQDIYVIYHSQRYDGDMIVLPPETIDRSKWNAADGYGMQYEQLFYEPNKYHYKDVIINPGSYLLDTRSEWLPDREYYKLQAVHPAENIIFYQPGKTYIDDPVRPGKYMVDYSDESSVDISIPHYQKRSVYVINDDAHIYDDGAIWNPEATQIPANITLGRRPDKYVYELVALPEFGRNLNTMHGLLLRTNQILENLNPSIRYLDTVAGSMNTLKDIFAKFDILKPHSIVTVDEYGRVTTLSIDTEQSLTKGLVKDIPTENTIQHETGADRYPIDTTDTKKWISVEVYGRYYNPTLYIHHNYMPVSDSAIEKYDLNTTPNIVSSSTNEIPVYNYKFDEMGHMVGTQHELYVLPNSYKTFKLSELSISDNFFTATGLADTTELTAVDSQDEIYFGTGNKWLSIDFSIVDNKKAILFEHTKSSLADGLHSFGEQTPDYGAKFKIPTITTDKAGHIIAYNYEEVSIPVLTLNDTTYEDSDVLLNIAFAEDSTNTITKTYGKLGERKLGAYTAIEENPNENLTANSTIAEAFAALDQRMATAENNLYDNVEDIVSELTFDFEQDPSTLEEEDALAREEALENETLVIPKKTLQDLMYMVYDLQVKVNQLIGS